MADGPTIKLLKTIPVPVSSKNTTAGALYSFDISFVDPATGTYYLADRSNKVVDIVHNGKGPVTQATPNNGHAAFAGFTDCVPPAGANDCAGPNGAVAHFSWLFVTDAPSRVLTFDLRSSPPKTVSEVTTKAGEPTRADELAYDPEDGLILSINNAATPPFGALIKLDKTTGGLTVKSTIIFDATHGVDATNGAEQPVWDHKSGKFYLSIPELSGDGSTNLHGAVLRISTTGTVEATYKLDSAGQLASPRGPVTTCSSVAIRCSIPRATNGPAMRTGIPIRRRPNTSSSSSSTPRRARSMPMCWGVGAGDEVWFNKRDQHYYTASSGSPLAPNAITPARPPADTAANAPVLTAQGAALLGVIDAGNKTLDQLVPKRPTSIGEN